MIKSEPAPTTSTLCICIVFNNIPAVSFMHTNVYAPVRNSSHNIKHETKWNRPSKHRPDFEFVNAIFFCAEFEAI